MERDVAKAMARYFTISLIVRYVKLRSSSLIFFFWPTRGIACMGEHMSVVHILLSAKQNSGSLTNLVLDKNRILQSRLHICRFYSNFFMSPFRHTSREQKIDKILSDVHQSLSQ